LRQVRLAVGASRQPAELTPFRQRASAGFSSRRRFLYAGRS
jgi:hypothetical protein